MNGAGFAWSQSDDVSESFLNLNSISSRPFWTYRWWPVADEDFGYSFGVLSKDSLSISCSTVKSPTNNRAPFELDFTEFLMNFGRQRPMIQQNRV